MQRRAPMDKPSKEVISAEEMAKRGSHPIVLYYQPLAFIKLTEPEDLRRWEADLRDKVGLKVPLDALALSGCDTVTGGGGKDACDISD